MDVSRRCDGMATAASHNVLSRVDLALPGTAVFRVDSFATPEPGTLVLLLAGLPVVLRRRCTRPQPDRRDYARTRVKPKSRRTPASRAAFTLIEMLVSIAIIALLVGVLVPSLGRARLGEQQVACAGHLHSVAPATANCLHDNQDI